jgi:hypothetical protein
MTVDYTPLRYETLEHLWLPGRLSTDSCRVQRRRPAEPCAVPCNAFVRRRFIGLALLEPDRITAADRAAPHHSRVNTDVDLIMLGRGAQDARIPREIPLGQGRHHTAGA